MRPTSNGRNWALMSLNPVAKRFLRFGMTFECRFERLRMVQGCRPFRLHLAPPDGLLDQQVHSAESSIPGEFRQSRVGFLEPGFIACLNLERGLAGRDES